jgi:hypothetical protein
LGEEAEMRQETPTHITVLTSQYMGETTVVGATHDESVATRWQESASHRDLETVEVWDEAKLEAWLSETSHDEEEEG